jgi:hypothetical protein
MNVILAMRQGVRLFVVGGCSVAVGDRHVLTMQEHKFKQIGWFLKPFAASRGAANGQAILAVVVLERPLPAVHQFRSRVAARLVRACLISNRVAAG